MNNLAEASRYINSFARPSGLNTHSWRAIKNLALHAWECHFTERRFRHGINFLCNEFYLMIKTPEGKFIIPEETFSYDPKG
jgi:hypothetical protein